MRDGWKLVYSSAMAKTHIGCTWPTKDMALYVTLLQKL